MNYLCGDYFKVKRHTMNARTGEDHGAERNSIKEAFQFIYSFLVEDSK